MAKEILEKIKDAEREADSIILSSNDAAKDILKNIDAKIKADSEKILLEASKEAESIKKSSVEKAEEKVKFLLDSEAENIKKILEIDDIKIDKVVDLLAERIVK